MHTRSEGDVGEAIRIEGQDGQPVRLAYKRLHTRSVLTLFGEIPDFRSLDLAQTLGVRK